MNRNRKPRWPSWMLVAVSATSLVVGFVGVGVTQMIAQEEFAKETLKQWHTERLQRFKQLELRFTSTEISRRWTDSDRNWASGWQDIVSQVKHPYLINQITNFRVRNPWRSSVVWEEYPKQLAQFTANNRVLIDAIYRQFPDEQSAYSSVIQESFRFEATGFITQLIFLDAATCLSSHDRERFQQALRTLQCMNKLFRRGGDLDDIEPMIYLLHSALDQNLLSDQEVADWTLQLCRELFCGMNDASLLRAGIWGKNSWSGKRIPASIQLILAQREEAMMTARIWFVESAMNLELLATRVAALNHVQQHRAIPDSLAELKATQLVQEVEKTIAPVRKHVLFSIEYEKRNETEAIIQLNSKGPLSGTSYPVQETYAIKLTNP